MPMTELGWMYYKALHGFAAGDGFTVMRLGTDRHCQSWNGRVWEDVPGDGLIRGISNGSLDYERITPDEAHHLTTR